MLKSSFVFKLLSTLLVLFGFSLGSAQALGFVERKAESEGEVMSLEEANQRCEVVLAIFNLEKLEGQINVIELTGIIRSLRDEGVLPAKFVTKREARALGWQPGRAFREIPQLRGKAIGGDHFGNYEQRLPEGRYKEADLDYLGKKRNAKRLVYEHAEHMYVSIDHYESFERVPACH